MAKRIVEKTLRVASPGMFRVIRYDPVLEIERIEGDVVIQPEEEKKKLFDLVDEHNQRSLGGFFTYKRVYNDRGQLVHDEMAWAKNPPEPPLKKPR